MATGSGFGPVESWLRFFLVVAAVVVLFGGGWWALSQITSDPSLNTGGALVFGVVGAAIIAVAYERLIGWK